MTAYPSIGSYDLVVNNLNQFILAPQFTGGNPVLTSQRQILGYSGGYSVVYPIIVNGKKLALRCWIKDPGNVKERYVRVKKYLQSHPTSYLVDFDYVDKGIAVDGHQYPISYMEWIEGKTLSQFIDQNINNAGALNVLADQFLVMVKELHSKNISHGDLQDGNIIVAQNSSSFDLKLVDYDCLYAPTLQNWNTQDDLQGVPDYQHPKRHKKSNEKADYFSELVIYLSLLAYAEKPNLWKKGQEKRLLFTEKDFQNPASSSTFQLLQTLSPRIKHLADELRKFCAVNDTNQLVPLEQILTGTSGSATASHPSTIASLDSFFGTASHPSTTASLDSFFGSAPAPSSPTPAHQSVSSTPSSPSDFSSFFGSSPAQPVQQKQVQPTIIPQPTVAPPAQKSGANPLLIMFVILGLIGLGAFGINTINTQNTHATQTAVAQNMTATAVAQPIFTETFTYSGQWEWSDNDVTWDVSNGELIGTANSTITAWTLAGQSFKDIKVEVDIEKVSGIDNNAMGVICNATDNRHFYAFIIGADKSYNILKLDGDNVTNLLSEWKYSDVINSGNARNTVAAICNGGNLSLVVNGTELATIYDTSYAEGDIGLVIGLYETGTATMYFDNLSVYRP